MEVRLQVTNEKSNVKELRLGPETVIGRSSDCNLRIASARVSRRHCLIRVDGSQVFVRDLGSANGTEVDGVQIISQVDVPVVSGSTLAVGSLKFVFEFTRGPRGGTDDGDPLSTTHDIDPVSPPLEEEGDTRDYVPGQTLEPVAEDSDSSDSGVLDLDDEAVPDPSAGIIKKGRAATPPVRPPETPLETVFDSELAGMATESLQQPGARGRSLETRTDLLVEESNGGVKPSVTPRAPRSTGKNSTKPGGTTK
jgi:pSer/pThr/pTyr-binding forkhead associated (FHA) protein